MSRSLHRAAVLLIAAACSRSTPPPPSGPAADPAPPPGTARLAVSPATRVQPGARPPEIRPPPAPCLPDQPEAAPGALAEAARSALQAERPARALDCADEAVRLAPRLAAALAARADALAALDRLDEARNAYARTLAVAPEDPVALLGAAGLYVRRLSAERDALEIGLEYALRGARAALRPPHQDRALAAELHLLAAVAENDLGRSREALAHLDRARAALPGDPDVVYERGVALLELCRFDEARRAFERTLQLSPEDPWALHQLGLLAERRGEAPLAGRLLERARRRDPADFPEELQVDEPAFRAEVAAAVASLPDEDRSALAGVPIELADLPGTDDLLAVDPPLSPAILGLFRGPPQGEACTADDGPGCRSIVFYRKNLVRFVRTREELREQVRVTLLHELGHLRGESDEQLRGRGLE
jgi:tetratricopeptide (TPR) repeat protein